MIYSLPNGKVIHLTIEEYLDLTDQDIQFLMSIDAGVHNTSGPWFGSSIKTKDTSWVDKEDEDKSIDYIPEDEEKFSSDIVSLDNISEGVIELPEDDLE
jgi:hypothetical protein